MVEGCSRTDPLATVPLGKTGARVSRLGFGGSQLGDMFVVVGDREAQRCLTAARDVGLRYFDTSPFYGRGLSERRFGEFLRRQPRDSFVLSTKVGRVLFPAEAPGAVSGPGTVGALPFDFRFDYSYDGIMRSYEHSLERLGLDRVDLLLIHDLDEVMHGTGDALRRHFRDLCDSGFAALAELRSTGAIAGIGAGVNMAGMVGRYLDHCDLDFVLLAMPYTLLDQSALDADLPRCVAADVAVVIGAPFSSGILATGDSEIATYQYGPAERAVRDKTRRIAEVCERHGVPLRAAALQFPFGHEAVASVIPGVTSADQVADNVASMRVPIPSQLWDELLGEGLVRPDAPSPGSA